MEIKIDDQSPDEVMILVREVRSAGLKQGTDFDFAYHQSQYDPISGHFIQNKHAIFKFYNEKQGLIYLLKWT